MREREMIVEGSKTLPFFFLHFNHLYQNKYNTPFLYYKLLNSYFILVNILVNEIITLHGSFKF